jgi:hypothetical protein
MKDGLPTRTTLRLPERLSAKVLGAMLREQDLYAALDPTPRALIVDAGALADFDPRCIVVGMAWLANAARFLSHLEVVVPLGADADVVVETLSLAAPGLSVSASSRHSGTRSIVFAGGDVHARPTIRVPGTPSGVS